MQGDVVLQVPGGAEVLVGDVAAHGEDDHEGAEHGYRATRPDHKDTQTDSKDNTLYFHSNYVLDN